jgi:hypothetical protein
MQKITLENEIQHLMKNIAKTNFSIRMLRLLLLDCSFQDPFSNQI